ncbi:putative leader peptide [Actinoalloteichus hymeniacidonis]
MRFLMRRPLLTSRRHVDLCRQASAVCPD